MVWRAVIQSVTGILPLHISTDLPPVFRAIQDFLIMPVSNGARLESGFMPAFFIKFIVFHPLVSPSLVFTFIFYVFIILVGEILFSGRFYDFRNCNRNFSRFSYSVLDFDFQVKVPAIL